MVAKDGATGKGEQLKGKAKEMAGKVTGDKKLKATGQGDQLKGKARETFGKVTDR